MRVESETQLKEMKKKNGAFVASFSRGCVYLQHNIKNHELTSEFCITDLNINR